jgi:hypothetical protein
MVRGFGLAPLVVVVVAFAGASAGPARPLQSLRLVVSFAQLHTPEEVEQQEETRPSDARVPWRSIATLSPLSRSARFRRSPVERWLFQRPPPPALI